MAVSHVLVPKIHGKSINLVAVVLTMTFRSQTSSRKERRRRVNSEQAEQTVLKDAKLGHFAFHIGNSSWLEHHRRRLHFTLQVSIWMFQRLRHEDEANKHKNTRSIQRSCCWSWTSFLSISPSHSLELFLERIGIGSPFPKEWGCQMWLTFIERVVYAWAFSNEEFSCSHSWFASKASYPCP